MQPSLGMIVGMLPDARRAVRATSANITYHWAEYIVKQCYDQISNWRYLVDEISEALNDKTWPIGEIDMEDTKTFIDHFIAFRGDVLRRDRERILRAFLEGVFNECVRKKP